MQTIRKAAVVVQRFSLPRFATAAVFVLSAMPALSDAANRYVNAAGGVDSGECLVAASPCRTVTFAMGRAVTGSPGDTIWVYPGTYGSALGEQFPISVTSGVQLRSAGGSNVTIIDAAGANTRVLTCNGSNASTLVEGFTIRGGLEAGSASGPGYGGALYIAGGAQVAVRRNVFIDNTVRGGASVALANQAGNGYGGAIYSEASQPSIESNLFIDNLAAGGHGFDTTLIPPTGGAGGHSFGAAIAVLGGASIANNTFRGNLASGGGGGAYAGQGGSANGGAVYADGATIVNNIFANNHALGGFDGHFPCTSRCGYLTTGGANYPALRAAGGTVSNNLFYSNIAEAYGGGTTADTLGASAVQADPQFHSAPSNLCIGAASPARAAGTAAGAASFDFLGMSRPAPPSIGAYEPQGAYLSERDLDGDARSDILWRNVATGDVFRMLMNGLSIASAAVAHHEPNTAWTIVADADFNGDGTNDLLWRNATSGEVYVMLMGAQGLPTGGGVIYSEPNAAWKIVQTPDLDGDGRADIVWWNSVTGQVHAMLMNGLAITRQGFVYAEPDTNWRIVGAGDFAGSGRQNQLLWRHSLTGQVYVMSIGTFGPTFNITGAMIYQEPNTAWKIVATGDFDADRKTDILWRNSNTGQVYLMLMNGNIIAGQGLVYTEPNLSWNIVSTGDYDGDGKADLLWRNEASGQIHMMLMNGLAISNQAMVYQEGNLDWKVLGQREYGLASGVLP